MKRSKKLHRLGGAVVALALLAPVAGPAVAQSLGVPVGQPPASAILTIDQEALFASSLFGQRVQREAEEAARELSEENSVIQRALEAEELQLTRQRSQMDPEAFRALADAFDTKVQETRALQEQKSRDIARTVELERQQFLQRALPALSDIVRERNAVAILEIGSVFLSAESIDVTREAVARINADIGDGTVEPSENAAPVPRPVPGGEAAQESGGGSTDAQGQAPAPGQEGAQD
ncbi:Outer membrane protein (OmpH-like) [Pseudoruegeria aquimaris]|uniref:Outer membrane protein (OmpH-like) n=1 Tax=Pseudoruegeria aquimaris TaxID=393663 RepID=A0A1Y5S6Z5_9RHOB|nr:OmpH family outer membrane protein [Pseudoruegeria aquimaris]SLN33925.1 Outer membrane protein (OmpH-like) [Pseudoruegeria aquimaris]